MKTNFVAIWWLRYFWIPCLVALFIIPIVDVRADTPTPTPVKPNSNRGVLPLKRPLPEAIRRPLAPGAMVITDPSLVPNPQYDDFEFDAENTRPTTFAGGTFQGNGVIVVVGSSWNTWNPPSPGLHLVFAADNTFDILFSVPVGGTIVQAEPASYGISNVTMEAFNTKNQSLGTATIPIEGNAGAAYLGILADNNLISKVRLTSTDSNGFVFSHLIYGVMTEFRTFVPMIAR
jgi:hypothetical protein